MFTTCAILTEDLNMNVLLIKNFTKVQKIIVLFLKHVYIVAQNVTHGLNKHSNGIIKLFKY